MKWIPKWIGKNYSKIWTRYNEKTFLFEDAENICEKYTLNYLSELKKAQIHFVFEKKARKKVYRLVSPNLYAFSYAYNLDLSWLKQGAYANLILKLFMVLKEYFGENLISFGVYGSVARNKARKNSDLDLFLVFKEFQGTIGKRLDFLSIIERNDVIKNEIMFLNENNYFPRINYSPLNESELKMSFFTIDIAFDMKVVYDTNILNSFLEKIFRKINERKIERIYLDGERYYLDLKIKFGEVFEFE